MQLDITYRSIFRVALVLIAVWFFYQVGEVIAILFFGIILAATISPEVDKLQREGVPRLLGAILIYTLIILVFGILIYLLLPPTIAELVKFTDHVPEILRTYLHSRALPADFYNQLTQELAQASTNIFGWLGGILGGIGNILFVLIISFYLTVDDKGIRRLVQSVIPDHRYDYLVDLITRSQNTLSQWLKSQLILMIIMGIMASLALVIVGVPNAIALGAFAGILEIIPFVGPVIAAVLAILFAANVSASTALITLIVFIVIQQTESQILIPQIMKRAFEINPVLVLIALFMGAKLGGTIGIVASVPFLALVLEFSKDYFKKHPSP